MSLLAVAATIVVILALIVHSGLHTVKEGYVGLYWRSGALTKKMTEPGMHWMIPFLEKYAEVQVTIQTDSVSNIPCGTSGGVVVTFGKIEVVNRLRKELALATVANYTVQYDKLWIFDKVHHEINQFCSKHSVQEVSITKFDTIDEHLATALRTDNAIYAPGIDIVAVRVTKPQIPETIRAEFEKREGSIAALKVAEQQRLVVEAQAATEAKKLTIEAQRNADVAAINSAREVAQQRAEQEKEEIKDHIHISHEKALADAESYKLLKLAEANHALLTPEYLRLKQSEHISSNTKIYFGDKIPTHLGNVNAM